MPETVSKRAFADLLGVTQGRVSQLIKAGLPVEPNGRIHVAKGRAWVRDNVDANRRRASLGEDDDIRAVTPRLTRDAAEAEIATLKAARLAGNLIDRKATLRAIETRARQERDAWIGWTNRAAPELARIPAGDLATIAAALDRLVRDQLAALAAMPLDGLDHD
jgi:predicted transcriptional regulator